MGYVIFDPKVNAPLHTISRDEARAAYGWFIKNIANRLDELTTLVGRDGVVLDYSKKSLVDLHQWFFEIVSEERQLGNSTPSPELFSVCNDIGVYLSEFVVWAGKKIKWKFNTSSERDLSYQRAVIVGFDVKNPNYCIDFDYLICQYAFRILRSGDVENNLFSLMVEDAMLIAGGTSD